MPSKGFFMSTRRRFIAILPLSGLSMLSACGEKPAPLAAGPTAAPAAAPAPAQAPPPAIVATGVLVDPADAGAVALGYVADANSAKDAKHTAGAACSNCALFGGKAGDTVGPCPLFAGKQVAAKAWCTGYAKKA